MFFDVYNRFQLEVVREGEQWAAYRYDCGKRVRVDLVFPSSLDVGELPTYIDDLFHELAAPGERVRVISERS